MCTEDCALSVHHSVCITTITGLITLNHHNRKENWIFKINLQPQALWIKADLQTLRISLPRIN